MARKQKLIHLHGKDRYVGIEQVAIEKGEIVVTHGETAEKTELAVLDNNDAVVYFPSLAKVTAITDALDTKATGLANTALETAKAYADTLDVAMDGRVDALEATVKTLTGEGENGGVLALAKEYTDTEIGKVNAEVDLKANAADVYTKTQVDGLVSPKANAADVYAKTETYSQTEVDGLVSGLETKIGTKANSADVYTKTETYTKTEVEGLVSPKANSADVYTKAETYTQAEVNTELDKKADKATTYTKTEVDGLVSPKANSADVYAKTETYNKTEVDGFVNGLDGKIALKANSADVYTKTETYTQAQVDALVSPKANSADVYTKAETYTQAEVNGLVNGVDGKINTHANNGDIHVTAQQKTDWQAATDAINAFLTSENAQTEAIDTLKEIQNFLTSDDGTVQTLLDDVAKNKQDIANEKTARENADNGFETRIATLEGKFTGEDSVADQIAEAVAAEAELRIAEDAKKADKATTYTKTEVDGLVSPKANAADVYAKTETYNKTEVDGFVNGLDGKIALKANSADVYTKAETYTKTEVEGLVSPKANSADVYTKAETYTQAEVNTELDKKADKATTYTKTEVDGLVSPKANSADVYAKTETYNKEEVNTTVSGLETKIGTKANSADVYTKAETYTQAEVNALVSPKANSADVYAKTETYNKTEVDGFVSGLETKIGTKANDADVLKTVTVTEGNNITVTPGTNTVNLDFSAMVIDCGEY